MKHAEIDLDSLRWVVTRVNGKIASVALDLNGLKKLLDFFAKNGVKDVETITTEKISTGELVALGKGLTLDDLVFYGTDFQKHVWEELFKLAHNGEKPRMMSYSEFATICGNRPGLRAVAHAVGRNPMAFIVPCHRIIPKECIQAVEEAYEAAFDTIFSGADLYVFNAFDFGEYALGKQMKRDLIALELTSEE